MYILGTYDNILDTHIKLQWLCFFGYAAASPAYADHMTGDR